MTMARMIGTQPNFRIFMIGGLCLAMSTHTGIRAMKHTQTKGFRYQVSGEEKGHAAVPPAQGIWRVSWDVV